jgi:hypothetical protein
VECTGRGNTAETEAFFEAEPASVREIAGAFTRKYETVTASTHIERLT